MDVTPDSTHSSGVSTGENTNNRPSPSTMSSTSQNGPTTGAGQTYPAPTFEESNQANNQNTNSGLSSNPLDYVAHNQATFATAVSQSTASFVPQQPYIGKDALPTEASSYATANWDMTGIPLAGTGMTPGSETIFSQMMEMGALGAWGDTDLGAGMGVPEASLGMGMGMGTGVSGETQRVTGERRDERST